MLFIGTISLLAAIFILWMGFRSSSSPQGMFICVCIALILGCFGLGTILDTTGVMEWGDFAEAVGEGVIDGLTDY